MTYVAITSSDLIELFSDELAREFVRANMKHSYEEAILAHHPKAHKIDRSNLKKYLSSFVDELFSKFPKKIQSLSNLEGFISEFSRKRKEIPFMEEAYQTYRAFSKQKKRFSYLYPHLKGKKWVDIGCGSGELLNYIRTNHGSSFESLLGIEVGNFQNSTNYSDFLICDLKEEKPLIERSYDSGILLSVLHHVSSDDRVILTFLDNLDALGIQRLVVEEDVLIEPNDLLLPEMQHQEILGKTQPKLQHYVTFSPETQLAITAIADFFSNSLFGSHQMPFPFSFKSNSDWKTLFEDSGWTVQQINLLGFQKGNFNQVCHALFILDKSERI